jgi:hypothetical protein
MLQNHLNEGGTALIATKRYYFGVGGGSATLEGLLADNPNCGLICSVVKMYEDGSSNIREILKVQRVG